MRERGWGPLKNGDLLEVAQHEFDVFLTADRGIPHRQNLSRFDLAVVVLRAGSNSFEDLSPLMARATDVLPAVRPGGATYVGA